MTDQTTDPTTTHATTPPNTPAEPGAPAAPGIPSTVPPAPSVPLSSGVSADKYAQSIKRAQELESKLEKLQLAQMTGQERDKAIAAAEMEKQRAATEQLSQELARTASQAKNNATLAHYAGGLKDPLYLTLAPDIVLNDVGLLTDDSRAHLDKFRADRPELFHSTPTLTTPQPGASGKLAGSEWTAEQSKMLRAARVDPGARAQSQVGKTFGWLFGFDTGSQPWKKDGK